MTNDKLSQAYLKKARVRIKALEFMHQEEGYSDVVREAQECVELLLKGLLRKCGIEHPKTHDVSRTLNDHLKNLPQNIQANIGEICQISRQLRKDRELAFYGTEDWIPTEEYHAEDSLLAIEMTKKIFAWVEPNLL